MTPAQFQKIVWKYYKEHGRRALLWRTPAHTKNPYRILVSEIMLQQTQVSRVITKYPEFIARFPDFKTLAAARTDAVLRAWSGMGYNRRALYLQNLAKTVVHEYSGKLPHNPETLRSLPGIGKATAGSIAAFAFNMPVVFIETNIRRAIIHSFFPREKKVQDEDVAKLVEETLDKANPREWYYALMDYGAMLAVQEKDNPNKRSAHYRAQPPFKGSRRALRGQVLRLLLAEGKRSERQIAVQLKESVGRIREVLEVLEKEKFVVRKNGVVKLV